MKNSKDRHEEAESEFSSLFHSSKILWPLIFDILPLLKDTRRVLGAAAGRVSFLSQAPGALEQGTETTIIITDTSKLFCIKQRRILFDDNKFFQPSNESGV